MNYKKHYDALIERAKTRKLNCYTERHHIIPRCMGGSDDKDNLVDLTAEEHYVAHQLLCKMYPENHALAKSVLMMTVKRTNNKIYGWVRKRHSEAMKESQSGEGNSQYGTRWIHNLELKESKKIPKNEPLPEGWEEGRKIKFDDEYQICAECGSSFRAKSKKIKFCSSKCKSYHRSPNIKIIDDNIDDILRRLKQNKSISKTLREFGIKGVRAGNGYLSEIAKQHGIEILKRRNSPD